MATPPTPGEAQVGQLLVDPEERTIWVGVDASRDPGRALLISDIVGLQAADAATLESANDYTDAVALTRAPVSHTHTPAQIVGFDAAAQAAVKGQSFIKNMIIMWYGNPANVGYDWSPTGNNSGGENMVGWAICDGNPHFGFDTPDMTGKFPLGSVNNAGTEHEGGELISVSPQGNHSHAGSTSASHALTVAEMPLHSHEPSAGQSFVVRYSDGTNDHGIDMQGGTAAAELWGEAGRTNNMGSSVAHSHTLTIAADGGHAHTFACAATNVPYVTVMFIIRIQ